MGNAEDKYEKMLPFMDAASKELGKLLTEALSNLGDPHLVRARVDSRRIKTLASLKRKAGEHSWTVENALDKAIDLVGFRVVCNNLQDVERAASVLASSLKTKGIPVTIQDLIKNPTRTGYRASHLRIRFSVEIAGEKRTIGCEVQIRSLLQHAWAELSRADVYTKETELAPSLVRSMERLAQQIHVADQIANDIREEIARPHEGKPPKDGSDLTGSSIAFLYQQAFGAQPPDYVIQSALNEFKGTPVRADGLALILKDSDFLRKLGSHYEGSFGWEPTTEQIFRWAVYAAAHGINSALQLVAEEGLADREEIDSAFIGEVESELPQTWQDLVERIEHTEKDDDPQHDILRWAETYGALGECAICATKIVHTDSLTEVLVEHYGLEGDEADEAAEDIEHALFDSGVETETSKTEVSVFTTEM